MPFEKGHTKVGGRKKGTLNGLNQTAQEIAQRLGVNPLEILLMFAKEDYEGLGMLEYKTTITKSGQEIQEASISPELRQKAAKDACEYLFPKLKSIEHTGEGGDSLFAKLLSEIHGSK